MKDPFSATAAIEIKARIENTQTENLEYHNRQCRIFKAGASNMVHLLPPLRAHRSPYTDTLCNSRIKAAKKILKRTELAT